ncbi:MAG TPA: radical SAM family heme chaperone HemW [Abditibacteriaceae bacterium]
MFGLYVHIPFCARRCPYCDFAIHVGARPLLVADYLAALKRELETVLREHNESDGRPLSSIFFGGGTPSLLQACELNELLALIFGCASVEENLEISLESNPEHLDEAKLAELRRGGWNRLSMGAQSFDDEALKRIGRVHRAADIEAAFRAGRRAGFENISLDLMYALPGQSRERWRETLQRAVALEAEHISCYSLTIEPGTHFARRAERGDLIPLEDDAQSELMLDAVEIAASDGIERYEVSNYARPGYECRHNLNYWRGGDYLAAGNGAHGHLNGHRWWNERDTKKYVELMQTTGSARAGDERLQSPERWNEIMMLGLRLREGFSPDEAARRLGFDARPGLQNALHDLKSRGVLVENSGVLSVPPRSLALADAVAAKLIL